MHIQTHGPSSQAFHLLGLIQDARGDRFGAVDYYRKVLYLDPLDPGAHFGLGMALLRQGRRPDARAHFRAVVKFLAGRGDAETTAGPDALPVGWLRAACRSLSDDPARAGGGG